MRGLEPTVGRDGEIGFAAQVGRDFVDVRDAGGELDRRGDRGRCAQRHERVERAAVELGQRPTTRIRGRAAGRDVGVLGEEDRLEAARLRFRRQRVRRDRVDALLAAGAVVQPAGSLTCNMTGALKFAPALPPVSPGNATKAFTQTDLSLLAAARSTAAETSLVAKASASSSGRRSPRQSVRAGRAQRRAVQCRSSHSDRPPSWPIRKRPWMVQATSPCPTCNQLQLRA